MVSKSVEARLRNIESLLVDVRSAVMGPENNPEDGLLARTRQNTKDIDSLKAWRWWTLGGTFGGGLGLSWVFDKLPWGGG